MGRVLNGEPGGLAGLGWRWRRRAGGERWRPTDRSVLKGLGQGRWRRRSGGWGSWGWRRRGHGESRWVLVAVRGGQRSRGRGRRWTLDCTSDLHPPLGLHNAARVWRQDGGVPQWPQGGRGVGP